MLKLQNFRERRTKAETFKAVSLSALSLSLFLFFMTFLSAELETGIDGEIGIDLNIPTQITISLTTLVRA